jgi:hypothetical protein
MDLFANKKPTLLHSLSEEQIRLAQCVPHPGNLTTQSRRVLIHPLEDLDHLLRRFLYLQIQALERAAKEADDTAKKKARNEAFTSATGAAIVIVGSSLTAALVFAGLVHLDLVGLFAPGHTSKEAMGLVSQVISILPANITSLVSADNLKGAAVAFLALVAAHAAINRTVAAAVAVTLINLLLAAEFIVIGGSRALSYPTAVVYLLVALAVVVTTVTMERLLPIGVQGQLSEDPLPAWRWIKEKNARID